MRKGTTCRAAKRYEVFRCKPEDSMREAVASLIEKQISALVVVNEDKTLAGVLSRTDVVRAHLDSEEWAERPVENYMSRGVVTVGAEDLLADAARLMADNRIHRVVVVDEQDHGAIPLSVISDTDLVFYLWRDDNL